MMGVVWVLTVWFAAGYPPQEREFVDLPACETAREFLMYSQIPVSTCQRQESI